MEFSEKLQKLRKEHNITQEALADKLNVTRQAVSKWESGTAYPDTDKLIQISKIFNISLDELINDSVISKDKKEDKLSFKEIINKFLDFITKTIDMFFAMTFGEKIKCIFEMGVIIIIIFCLGFISSRVIINLSNAIFSFIPYDFLRAINYIVESLLYLMWAIVGIIIFIKVFKERYLDYYVVVTDNSIDKLEVEKPIPELKEKKEVKVVIRDPEHSNLNIFNKLLKICLFMLKCFSVLVAIPVVMLFIGLVIVFVISVFYISYGLFFNGITLAILGGLLFTYLIIEFIYNLVFNRTHAYKKIFIIFIISICLMGIGCGITAYSLSQFRYVHNDNTNITSNIIEWDDNLVLDYDIRDDLIVIDNSIDYIKLDIKTYDKIDTYVYSYYSNDYNEGYYKIVRIVPSYNNMDYYKYFIDNLKDKLIVLNDMDYQVDRIYISDENLAKLKNNYNRYYNDFTY